MRASDRQLLARLAARKRARLGDAGGLHQPHPAPGKRGCWGTASSRGRAGGTGARRAIGVTEWDSDAGGPSARSTTRMDCTDPRSEFPKGGGYR